MKELNQLRSLLNLKIEQELQSFKYKNNKLYTKSYIIAKDGVVQKRGLFKGDPVKLTNSRLLDYISSMCRSYKKHELMIREINVLRRLI